MGEGSVGWWVTSQALALALALALPGPWAGGWSAGALEAGTWPVRSRCGPSPTRRGMS